MGDVVNFPRKSALFSNHQRAYFAQRLRQVHGLDERTSEVAVAGMESEMCETVVSTARQIAKIVGYRLGKKLFRLITKE